MATPSTLPGPSPTVSHAEKALLSVGFNQEYGCFACGTQTGFRVYSCDHFREIIRHEFDGAGIALVEMLFRSSILALVGGGRTPKYPSNKVIIWNDDQHRSRCIGELSFRSKVRAVRLRRDKIVVVLEFKIYVYNFADLKLLHEIETLANTKAICALSSKATSCVLACPGQQEGEIRIELLIDSLKKTRLLLAHNSSLACLALSHDGAFLATASSKGTLIRDFSTVDGSKLQEVRRGADQAEIYSIAFSENGHWLVASSDKGTVHVFALNLTSRETRFAAIATAASSSSNEKSTTSGGRSSCRLGGPSSLLSFASSPLILVKGVLPKYFSSEWSFAKYRVPEEIRTIVAFGPEKNTVVIVGANASYYRCSFDEIHGGEMALVEFERFMKDDKAWKVESLE